MSRLESKLKGLVEFWRLAARLKQEHRKGWVQKLQLVEAESVADHSFGVALLTLYEGERRRFDIAKLLKFALIHDLEEAVTGDFTPHDKRVLGARSVKRARRYGINYVLTRLPPSARNEYRRLWTELKGGKTREARLLKDLDLLEMALQAREYERGGTKREKLMEFYSSAIREIQDPACKRIVGQLAVSS